MQKATQLNSIIEELKKLNSDFTHLKSIKKLRSALKIIIVGFFLWKNVDERLSENKTQRNLLRQRTA